VQNSLGSDSHVASAATKSLHNEAQGFSTQFIEEWRYPMYFGNIIMPEDFPIDPNAPTQAMPDVSAYMQDDNLWTNDLDFFDSNMFDLDT
jgi:hypothetical protein